MFATRHCNVNSILQVSTNPFVHLQTVDDVGAGGAGVGGSAATGNVNGNNNIGAEGGDGTGGTGVDNTPSGRRLKQQVTKPCWHS